MGEAQRLSAIPYRSEWTRDDGLALAEFHEAAGEVLGRQAEAIKHRQTQEA